MEPGRAAALAKKKLNDLQRGHFDSIQLYINQAASLASEIRASGWSCSQQEVVHKIVDGLGPKYTDFTNLFDYDDDKLVTITALTTKVLNFETKLNQHAK